MAVSMRKKPSSQTKAVLFQKYEIELSYHSRSYYHDHEVKRLVAMF